MLNIISKVVPYKEILNRIDSFDESQYKIIYPISFFTITDYLFLVELNSKIAKSLKYKISLFY